MSQDAHSYKLSRGCRINHEGHGKLDRLGSRYMDACVDGMHIDLDFKCPTPPAGCSGYMLVTREALRMLQADYNTSFAFFQSRRYSKDGVWVALMILQPRGV